MIVNSFYSSNKFFSSEELAAGRHRHSVGGIWNRQGNLQLDICKKYGLAPNMKLLDFGCGCLRGGVKFIDYLDQSNYYGIDIHQGLLQAGLEYEVPLANLTHKVNDENFLITDNFEIDFFKVKFDFIFSQSVFSHLTLNHYLYFLEKSYNCLSDNGKIILSLWLCEETDDLLNTKKFISDIIIQTSLIKDTFHYKFSTLQKLADDKWNCLLLDDYHPRKQKFILLTKK